MYLDRHRKRPSTVHENRRVSRARYRAMVLEPLEERYLLSTFDWVGGTSGNFNVAANWQGPGGSGVPGASDDAVVNTAGVTIQVPVSVAVNSLTTLNDTTIHVTGGTFAVADANGSSTLIGTLDVDAGATFAVNGGAANVGAATDAGMIDVNAGELTFAAFSTGVVTLSGAISVAERATVDFFGSAVGSGPTVTVNAGASFDGPGLYLLQQFGRPTITLNENLTVQNLEVDAGTINGIGTLTVPGTLTWSGGTFSGAGTLVMPQGSALNISGFIQLQNGYTLDNDGTAMMSAGGDTGSTTSAVINNTGTFVLQQGVDFGLTPETVFNNRGTLIVNGGTALETSQFSGTLNNTGVVNVASGTFETAGVVQDTGAKLTGGTWNIAAAATLNLDNDNVNMPLLIENDANVTLGGAGATFTNFGTLTTNAGSLTLGPGAVFKVSGPFTQTSTGTLTPQIGGSSGSGAFGQLAAAGAVTLGGTLDLDLVNGYAPTIGDSYALVTYPSVTGTFAQINKPSSGAGHALGARVTPMQVLVSASSASSPADLNVQSVSITPSSGLPGGTATVAWNVTNTGSGAAFGAWEDAVYLSATPTLDASGILLAVTPHTGGLDSGQSYQGSATITLPALSPGPVYAIVVVDRRGVVLEGSSATLVAASAQPYTVSTVPTLTLGTPTTGSFSAANQDRYFQVTVSAGQSLALSLDSQASGGSLLLSASFGIFPGPNGADETTQGNFAPSQSLVISPTQQGTYYIDVHSQYGTAASTGFRLTATTPGFRLSGVSPATLGAGPVTLAVSGAGLTPDTTYILAGAGAPVDGTLAEFVSGSLAYVTFDLTGHAAGTYSLKAIPSSGAASTLGPAVTVTPASVGGIDLAISGPGAVRLGATYSVVVTYTNTGDTDAPAPLIDVNKPLNYAAFGLDPQDMTDNYEQFLGVEPNGPAGILRAGQGGQFTFYFRPETSNVASGYVLTFFVANDITTNDTTPMDYATLGPILRPNGLTDAQWNAEYAEFQRMVGPTEGDYVRMLDANATLLPPNTQDPSSTIGDALVELDRAAAALGNSLSGVIASHDARVSLANQTVVADNTTTGDQFIATTLNDGSFVVPNVTPGSYTLSVVGAVVNGSSSVTVASGQAVSGIDLDLGFGGAVDGVVTTTGGATVSSPTVTAIDATGDGYAVTGDTLGRYELSGLAPGTYTLYASADGLAQASLGGIIVNGNEQAQNLVLTSQSVITGTVTPAAGGPTGGTLLVSAQPVDDPSTVFNGTAQGNTYSINNLPAGTYNITLSLDGYVTQTVSNVTVAQGGARDDGTTALPLAASLSGTVTSLNPAAAPAYALVTLAGSGTAVAATLADATGAFSLAGLSPGTYTIQVLTAAGPITAQSVTLAPGQALTEVSIAIPASGASPQVAAAGIHAELLPSSGPITPSTLKMQVDMLNNQQDRARGVQAADSAVAQNLNPMCAKAKDAQNLVYDALKNVITAVTDLVSDGDDASLAIQQELAAMNQNPGLYSTGLPAKDAASIDVDLARVDSAALHYIIASEKFDAAVNNFNAVNASCNGTPPPQKAGGVLYQAAAEQAEDPNEKSGPGFGAAGFVAANQTLPYEITFENDPKKATAPAQEVTVTDQLDNDLDWTTFSLGAITFGSNTITVPPGLQSFTTTVATTNTDGTPLNVVVTASLDLGTGLATWIFRSVDPATGLLPAGAKDGFLPVEDGSGRGIASVYYTIKPKTGLSNGTTFSNTATVVFDTNSPITTNSVPGTIDSVAPTSAVRPLPATESTPSFTVSWSGSDAGGSGIATYDIFVSTNGGAFLPFETNTTATSATFTGQAGDKYAFYSVATDNIGNVQPTPAMAQAVTTVSLPAPVVSLATPSISGTTLDDTGSFTSQGSGPFVATVDYGDKSGLVPLSFSAGGSFTLSHTYTLPGTYIVTVGIKNGAGIVGVKTLTVTIPPPSVVLTASGYGAGRDAFVTTLYSLDLGRLPEPAGLRYWSGRLAAGVSPEVVAVAIWNSAEHRTLVNRHLAPPVTFLQSYDEALFLGKLAAKSPHSLPAGPLAVAKASTARP
jgi:Carboxypeptidase regulatory-like domain/CARDB/Domain of unknown function (DUF4214)/Polysaccharide lyase family 4, domain II